MAVAGSAIAGPIQPSATVVPSNSSPGVRPVSLIIKIRLELQCGQPGVAPITITLPAAEKVPRTIPLTAVRVSGRLPATLSRQGRRITITPAAPSGVTCDVIAPGTITIRISKTANFGNPDRPGNYRIAIDRQTLHLQANLAIHT